MLNISAFTPALMQPSQRKSTLSEPKMSMAFKSPLQTDTISFGNTKTSTGLKQVAFFDIRDPDEASYLKNNKPEAADYAMYQTTLDQAVQSPELYDKIKDAEVVSVLSNSKVDKAVIDKLPNLRLVVTRATGYDNIDRAYCKEKGISVNNAPNYARDAVAEFAFALLQDLNRKVSLSNQDLKMGQVDLSQYKGMNLHGKTIGIIGAGQIGSQVAHIAHGFGMNVVCFDDGIKEKYKQALIDDTAAEFVSLPSLLKQADVISLNCKYDQSNHHLLGAEEFKMMGEQGKKPIIINTARGPLVDSKALLDALDNGYIKGAGLDVYEGEKVFNKVGLKEDANVLSTLSSADREILEINKDLAQRENVIMTPHSAYDTIDAIEMRLDRTTENIDAFTHGHPEGRYKVNFTANKGLLGRKSFNLTA